MTEKTVTSTPSPEPVDTRVEVILFMRHRMPDTDEVSQMASGTGWMRRGATLSMPLRPNLTPPTTPRGASDGRRDCEGAGAAGVGGGV